MTKRITRFRFGQEWFRWRLWQALRSVTGAWIRCVKFPLTRNTTHAKRELDHLKLTASTAAFLSSYGLRDLYGRVAPPPAGRCARCEVCACLSRACQTAPRTEPP